MLHSVCCLALAVAGADERQTVGVPGAKTEFPIASSAQIAGKEVALRLTGTAMRTKAIFNVYAIASYVAADAACKTAEELAAADVPKRLDLVFEREVSGRDMATAVRASVEANHPGAFEPELKACAEHLAKETLKKGLKVALIHTPGVGIMVMLGEGKALRFDNVKFSAAMWDAYLGKHNVGDKVKRGLVSRL